MSKKRKHPDSQALSTTTNTAPSASSSHLITPLKLPRDAAGSVVEVFWAGDDRWYRATVTKCDFVNQAVCVKYEGESYDEGVEGEWEPALAAGMRARIFLHFPFDVPPYHFHCCPFPSISLHFPPRLLIVSLQLPGLCRAPSASGKFWRQLR